MFDINFIVPLVTIAIVIGVILGACAFLIYVERRIAAFVQDRHGPNRVGPFGLFQSIADGLKFLLKEDVIPGHVDKFLYLLAPALAVSTALFAFAVVPFGPDTQLTLIPGTDIGMRFIIAPNIDIGLLFIFAIGGLNVYGVILGGWAANNKYSLLGALRSSAQIVSYEIPMGMSVIGVILLSGSLNLESIMASQSLGTWLIFYQPLAFLLFMVSSFAECNRLPFDLAEAEQELVGGFHTEYSALKFALFFLGEYAHMITTSFLMIILFFGGWHFPFIAEADSFWLLKLIVLLAKVTVVILFFMLIRWTIPRFRFDQLMNMAWKILIPLALVNLVCVMCVLEFSKDSAWILFPISLVILFVAAWLGTLTKPTPPRRLVGAIRPNGKPTEMVAQ